MKIFLLIASCLLMVGVIAQSPTIQWQKTIGGDSQEALFSAIETTDGGYLLGGYSSSDISGEKSQMSQGHEDYWVVKIDGLGNILWDKTFGGDSTDYLQVVLQTADGGYMLGGYSYSSNTGDKSDPAKGSWDTWLIKTDALGNIVWDKSYGGDEKDGIVSMKQTADGGYLFWAVSKTDANGDKTEATRGLSDYWLVKIDSLGTIEWDKTIGGSNMDHILSVKETSDGGYILGGFTMSGVGGDKTSSNFGFWDYWLIKLDSARNIEWDRSFGGTSSEHIMTVKETNSGGYLIGGFSSSGANGNKTEPGRGIFDYWMVQTDSLGNKLWDKAYGGNKSEEMRAGINMTNSGHYILGGFSQSGISGEKSDSTRGADDFWLLKTDTLGNIVWDKTIGGSGTEFLYSIIPTSDEGYLVAGWSDSPISGEKTDSSRGSFDFWIVKLAPDFSALEIPFVNYFDDLDVTIYPNPFTTSAQMTINSTSYQNEPLSIIIYDSRGIQMRSITTSTGEVIELNKENLPSGLYIYKIIRADNMTLTSGKFIIN